MNKIHNIKKVLFAALVGSVFLSGHVLAADKAGKKQQLEALLNALPLSNYQYIADRSEEMQALSEQVSIDPRSILRYRFDSQRAYYLNHIGEFEAADALVEKHANNPYTSKAPRAHARFLLMRLERADDRSDYEASQVARSKIIPMLERWPPSVRGDVYQALGTSYAVFLESRQAIKYLTLAESHFKQDTSLTDDQRLERFESVRVMLGYVYFVLQDYDSALLVYKSILADAAIAGTEQSFHYYNIGLSYMFLEQHKNSLEYAMRAAESAVAHDDKLAYALAIEMQARAYFEMGQVVHALELQREAHDIYTRYERFSDLFSSHVYLSRMHRAMGDIEQANRELEKTEQYKDYAARVENDPVYIKELMNYHERRGEPEKALGVAKRLLDKERDDFNNSRKQQAARLMIEYELDSAKREAAHLKEENALKAAALEEKEARETLWRKVAMFITVAVVMLIIFAFREFQSRRKFHHLAMTDPLTNVPNRRAVMKMAEQALQKQQSCLRPVSLAMIDLDHFKQINDTHGHDVGDEVLKQFVAHCAPFLRKTDHIGRLGGEEFLLVLNDADAGEVEQIFARLQASLKNMKVLVDGELQKLPLTVSMGAVVECSVSKPPPGSLKDQVMALIKRADDNVYAAKHNGRDRVVVA